MDKIVDLGEYKEKRPEIVWECRCGSQKFYILQDSGGAKCTNCSRVVWFAIGDDRENPE